MINFGKDVFEEGKEEGREKSMIDLIMRHLQCGHTFKEIIEYLLLNDEEIKHYTYLLQEKGITI